VGREQEVSIPMFERTIRRVGLLGASAALFAACAGGGSPTTAPVATTTATTPPAATTAPASQAAAGITLAVGTDATLGKYVTGANGMSLYIFTKDAAGATTSACSGQCAANWPALTVTALSDVTAGAGVTGALGTITGADGKLQVTLAGHPLYYFKGDSAAGDINGQGLNSVWYLAGVDGSLVGQSDQMSSPAASKGCSGPTCY
jgi:predicted lipoprotein with Yx(FWY)xxD motif